MRVLLAAFTALALFAIEPGSGIRPAQAQSTEGAPGLPGLPPAPPAAAEAIERYFATPEAQRDPERLHEELLAELARSEAAGRNDQRATLLTYLAIVEGERGRNEAALARVEEALQLRSGTWFLHSLHGQILLTVDRAETARQAFDRALDLAPAREIPARLQVHLYRSFANRALRRFAEAAEDLRVILDYDLHNTELLYQRAVLHSLAGQKRVALRQLNDLIQRVPNAPEPLRDRAEVLIALRDYAGAGRSLDEVARLVPGDPRTELLRGRLAYARGDLAAAVEHHARAFDLGLAQGLPDPYGLLWLRALRLRAGQADAADLERRRGLARLQDWPAAILSHLMGETTAEELLATARAAEAPHAVDERLTEAHFFIAQKRLAEGRGAEAKRHLEAAAALDVVYFVENDMARIELDRLP